MLCVYDHAQAIFGLGATSSMIPLCMCIGFACPIASLPKAVERSSVDSRMNVMILQLFGGNDAGPNFGPQKKSQLPMGWRDRLATLSIERRGANRSSSG